MELLSPARDLEAFYAAADAGADAVYFGGTAFGARSAASSFDEEAAKRAVFYARTRGISTYLTVNTLLRPRELEEELYPFLLPYYRAGVDGVIVQDLGVASLIGICFPDWRLHASTQMTVCSAPGVRWLKKQGFCRMVAPRELSISELASLCEVPGMEVEVFVHGALCVCYSGQCLMSSVIGGRSGNRGRCAQPCRLPYTALEKGSPVNTEGAYLLSMKDLCGIADLPALSQIGVSSLKIEGRLKQASYAAGVTASYRRALDALESGADEAAYALLVKEETQRLYCLGNRGFTDRYLFVHNDAGLFSQKDASHHHNFSQDTIKGHQQPSNPAKVALTGVFRAKAGQPLFLSLTASQECTVTAQGPVPESSLTQAAEAGRTAERLSKTGGTPFEITSLSLDMDEGLFLRAGDLNALRREALSSMTSALMGKKRSDPIPLSVWKEMVSAGQDSSLPGKQRISDGKRGRESDAVRCPERYGKKKKKTDEGGAAAAAGETKETLLITAETTEQAETALRASDVLLPAAMALPLFFWTQRPEGAAVIEKAKAKGWQVLAALPPVLREDSLKRISTLLPALEGADGFYCRSLDGVAFLLEEGIDAGTIQAGAGLYTWTSAARCALEAEGIRHFCAPLEENRSQLAARGGFGDFLCVYGRTPLMRMAGCPRKNLTGCDPHAPELLLRDRKGITFPLIRDCETCTNTLYNALPICLFNELDTVRQMGYRPLLAFTVESAQETAAVIGAFCSEADPEGIPVTRGAWRRGVL